MFSRSTPQVTTMRTVDALIERIRAQGGKATSQRILIWSALAENRSHPTAETTSTGGCGHGCPASH